MLHLRPLTKEQAKEHVKSLYPAITEEMDVESVPLVFQYLANFPDFFAYVWYKCSQNIQSTIFTTLENSVITSAHEAIKEIYTPSKSIGEFMTAMLPHEQEQLRKTVLSVMHANAKLLILTIGIRESIKGVFIGQKLIAETISQYAGEDVNDDIFSFKQKISTSKSVFGGPEHTIANSSMLLVPLFSTGITVSSLPQFFSLVDKEMHVLLTTEKYLEKRVFLEQFAMKGAYQLPYELGASYQEIIRLAGKEPYFHELLYLLVETFPTAYPRMLFTSALMQRILTPNSSLIS